MVVDDRVRPSTHHPAAATARDTTAGRRVARWAVRADQPAPPSAVESGAAESGAATSCGGAWPPRDRRAAAPDPPN